MIIGAYVEHAAPEHAAGAEWTIQDTFSWLAKRRHDCRIVARSGYNRERRDGVLVYSGATDDELAKHFLECDVMLTQLDATMHAQLLAMTYQTPLVQYVHSENQIDQFGIQPQCSALVVFNAQHVADACAWWPGESVVCHPAVDWERVAVDHPGACVGLINLSNAKGGTLLYSLAQAVEGTPFLGVMGAYGTQAMSPLGLTAHGPNETASGLPANLRVMTPTRNMREVFAYVRVLLVLSHAETYGRVAAEAASNGIPTICTDTPGLRECLGSAGVYVERDSVSAVEQHVRRAYTPAWDEWSAAATRQHENVLVPRQERELRTLERALKRIKKESPGMTL